MSPLLSHFADGLLSSPLRGPLTRAQGVWIACNERLLAIDTRARTADGPCNGPADSRHGDGLWYAPPDYRYLRRIMRILRPGPEDVFYDIGSGMGRVLCVAAQWRISRVVGIELDRPRCNIARRNADRMRGRHAPIDVRCEDASTADLSDGTIYYLYNPFGPETVPGLSSSHCATSSGAAGGWHFPHTGGPPSLCCQKRVPLQTWQGPVENPCNFASPPSPCVSSPDFRGNLCVSAPFVCVSVASPSWCVASPFPFGLASSETLGTLGTLEIQTAQKRWSR